MSNIEQTGFLYEKRLTDYVLGSTSPLQGIDLNPFGDWIAFAPSEEKQFKAFTFDTFSCSTFSATNVLEALFNFFLANNMISFTQAYWLKNMGYIEDGKFNFSDRFSAISNGTMPNGQYVQNVWDDFRKTGLIPEKDLPFGGNTQAEYLDKSLITQAMKDKAAKFLEMIIDKDAAGKYKINYEWVPVESGIEINTALKQAPMQVAVTKENPGHAITLLRIDTEFDSYAPFLKPRNRTIAYALKAIVGIKVVPIYEFFKLTEKTDAAGKHTFAELDADFRLLLDKMRKECGFAWKLVSGYRTQVENDALPNAVKDSAHVDRFAVDVFCIDSAKRDKIITVAKANGVTRFGIGETFIHLDVDKNKPQNVMWHYY